MTDIIIGPPPESGFARLKAWIKLHPQVLAAVVCGIFGLTGLWLGSTLKAGKLQDKLNTAAVTARSLEAQIEVKNNEAQRLETLLTPFRTITLEGYTGSEPEALAKLAAQMKKLPLLDEQRKAEIATLRKELAAAKSLAQPAALTLYKSNFECDGTNHQATLQFIPTKNERLNLIEFTVDVVEPREATLIGIECLFDPNIGFSFSRSEDARRGTCSFTLLGSGYPTIRIVVSQRCIIRVSGNYITEPLTLQLK